MLIALSSYELVSLYYFSNSVSMIRILKKSLRRIQSLLFLLKKKMRARPELALSIKKKKIFVIPYKEYKWDLQGRRKETSKYANICNFLGGTDIHFQQRLDKNYSLFQINQNNALVHKDRLPSLNKVMYFKP